MHVKQTGRVESKKKAELERVAALSLNQKPEILFLAQTEDNLTKEIATRIREAEQEVERTF